MVAIAVVVGAIAAGAMVIYVRGVEDRAYGDAALVKVFRVSGNIPKGMSAKDAVDGGMIEAGTIPAAYRPASALVELGVLEGKVALAPLVPGQVLVDGQFVDPRTAQATFAQSIPEGQVAVTVGVDEVRGVGRLLVPGDRVNILVNDQGAERTLFQNVLVIAIGTTPAPEAGSTEEVERPDSGVITFAVPPAAASKIALASQAEGGLYLTLVGPNYTPVPVAPVGPEGLYSGPLTPYEG